MTDSMTEPILPLFFLKPYFEYKKLFKYENINKIIYIKDL